MPDPRLPVAVLGATGSVGQRFVQLLDAHPWFRVAELVASDRSAGKRYRDAADWRLGPTIPAAVADLVVRDYDDALDSPVVFSALPGEVAEEIEQRMAREGRALFSNTSTHRMEPDVPLLIPEVNPDHVAALELQRRSRGWSGFIVTNPNCSTISLTLALAPLHQAFGLRKVFVTTLQALSGAGYNGVSGMDIIDNVVPYIGGEEDKLETEPLKLLGSLQNGPAARLHIEPARDLKLSAQCTRVPTTDGHLEMVSVELEKGASANDIIECWESWRPLPQENKLPSAPGKPVVLRAEDNRPQPRFDRDTEGGMASVVGRLRPCPLLDYKFALLGHNLVRGAAGGVLLIAELLKDQDYV